MPCYKPLKGFLVDINPVTKKGVYKITSQEVDHIEKDKQDKYYYITDKSYKADNVVYRHYVDIPCGRCIGCRLSNSKQKADRAVLELQYSSSSYFITLTYDDDHVPTAKTTCPDTGEPLEVLTLNKKDLQDFWKRLREDIERKGGKKIRYIACGEYGDHTLRLSSSLSRYCI